MIIARGAIVGVLLIGPTAIAFFSGGYFERARLVAGIVAWVSVALCAIVYTRCWPRTRAAWLTLGGLMAFAAWTVISIAWSPLGDEAQADAQRVVLYVGALIVGLAALREPRARRLVEPALAFGALLIVGEGLSERIFPGMFYLTRDPIAGGRLSQPLTYWNAVGIAAAMGFVLSVRLGGDRSRPAALRLGAAAAAAVLALGVYLTVSRGALLAAGVGLATLLFLASNREQALAMLATLGGSGPAILTAVLLSDVRSFHGSLGSRETDGLIVLLALVVGALISAGGVAGLMRRSRSPGLVPDPDRLVRRIAGAAVGLAAVGVVVAVILTATSRVEVNSAPSAASVRLATSETIRGDFWRAAVHGFFDHPVKGIGTGGFETEWRQRRTVLYSARDAHSLYLETLCELGLIGGLLLLALFAGVLACARRAYRLDPALSAGWIAAVTMWAVHAGFDWDWEMPAVTLPALVLVAAIVARSEDGGRAAETPVATVAVSEPSVTVSAA